jgi:hypothetical protein
MTQNGNYSVNRLLREHPDRLALLENSFHFDKNLIHNNYYHWSRGFGTKRQLKPEILKLVVYLLYPLQTLERKREIYIISYYLLITKKFKKDFKIITKDLGDVYGIQNLFNYILNGRPLKDLDTINWGNSFDCYLCLESKQWEYFECENHHPDTFLCVDCYASLPQKLCPLCRHDTVNFQTFDMPDTREISFKFNNHNFKKVYELDDGLTLFYCDGLNGITSLKISLHTFGSLAAVEADNFLSDVDGEDAAILSEYLPPNARYLFPSVEIFASYINSILGDNHKYILTILLDLTNPRIAFKFYCDHLSEYEIGQHPTDFGSLFMEKITMGSSFEGLIFNSPEGCYFKQHCDAPDARLDMHPICYQQDFFQLTI